MRDMVYGSPDARLVTEFLTFWGRVECAEKQQAGKMGRNESLGQGKRIQAKAQAAELTD